MGVTKFVLRRPMTVAMVLLCLLVFGISSVFNATMEQMPDTDQPMMIISANYSGTSPEDMDELVTERLENAVSALEGVETITSTSSDGRSMVMLEYGYDQDMQEAYDDLKKALNNIRGLPDDMNDPSIMEMRNGANENMMLSITNAAQENLYDYVDQYIVPELEKLATVAQVSVRGGSSEYIRVLLQAEKMKQYRVTVSNITSAFSAADLTYPSGSAISGNLELDVSTSMKHDTLEELLQVPITTRTGKIVYLEDIAEVGWASREMGGVSRYNGEETISISITKTQDSTAMKLSKEVNQAIRNLMADDSELSIEVARDEADSIVSSLKDVGITMVLAVIISMLILFLFFGDFKASLIVGSSIPVSILFTLIVMTRLGFSLNVITMSALVLSVGMMVDNSIVTLESCFRARERTEGEGPLVYAKTALEGAGEVMMSITGSTLTTCVVFIPLVFLSGMAGQLFGSLGYVIVISMAASLCSAVSIVPLTYYLYKPHEKPGAPLSRPIRRLQDLYRKIAPALLDHKWLVMAASLGIVALTVFLASGMKTELMTADDTGTVSVSISTRPGLLTEKAHDILDRAEEMVASDPNVESYMLRFGGQSGSITAYLYDNHPEDSGDLAEKWQNALSDIDNCTITVTAGASMSFMRRNRGYSVILQGTQYSELQEVSEKIVKELIDRDDVMNVHSSIENTAPVVSVRVDAVSAAAEGLTAAQIGSQIRNYLSGAQLATLTVDGKEISVTAEYPEGEYNTVPQLERILIEKSNGGYVSLSDVAEIVYKDSPSSISKENKEYRVTISADYTSGNVQQTILEQVVQPNLSGTVTIGTNTMDRMRQREFSGLYKAIAFAVFLVFVVLTTQFESMRFSLMVMTTIPFSLVGSFVLLKVLGVSISMTSLLGFLILVGTVVNNGILFVDTVNRKRAEGMEIREALIDAGAIRLRPIFMTTMTTVLSMMPMAAAFGSSGATTQGLAVVDIGGLTAGIFVSLLILPAYYYIVNGRKKVEVLDI